VYLVAGMFQPHQGLLQCYGVQGQGASREAALQRATEAAAALDRYKAASGNSPQVWLYRGAWEEWAPEQISMAVPLSPDELRQKRYAIFRHQSQKDRAMFPGPYDSREFWQRAEDRNMHTAALYDALGLPEYHAIEAFAKYPLRLRGA